MEGAVAEVLERRLPRLQAEIVQSADAAHDAGMDRRFVKQFGGPCNVPMAPLIPAPVPTVSSYSDPMASQAPKHSSKAPEPAVEVAASAPSASAAAAPAADPFAGLSPDDADTHRKPQPFANLLVDEIRLYNQAKVDEGRRDQDLYDRQKYDRQKEDSENSRATCQKRCGITAAAGGDYFLRKVLCRVAEDDLSVVGASFKEVKLVLL